MAEPRELLLGGERRGGERRPVLAGDEESLEAPTTPLSQTQEPTEFASGRRLSQRVSWPALAGGAGLLLAVVAAVGFTVPRVAQLMGSTSPASATQLAYRHVLQAEVKNGHRDPVGADGVAVERGMLLLDSADVDPCYIKKRAYNPIDMLGAIPMAASGPVECQERCVEQPGCKFFSFDHISEVCHLTDKTGKLGPVPVPFVSGPVKCPATSTTATTATSTTRTSVTATTSSATTTTPRTTLPPATTTPKPTQPAPSGGKPTLYCFEMAMPTGYEPDLVRQQAVRHASIFSCHVHEVFSTGSWELGNGEVTTQIRAQSSRKGSWGSWLNTQNFLEVWDTILSAGTFRSCDWTVKADPDAVFMPDRLQLHLQQSFVGGTTGAFYIKNCPKSFGLMGVLEVFSRKAVEVYGAHRKDCRAKFHPETSGEDGYIQACMEHSNVTAKEDFSLLIDGYCGMGTCSGNHWNVAFHPYKDTNKWFECWNQVVAAR